MNNSNTVRQKYTKQLLHHLQQVGDRQPVEVIVRVKDPVAMTRVQGMAGDPPDKIAEKEQQHTQDLLDNLVGFVHDLERRGAPVRLVDTSWLTHSVLATATPAVVRMLAEREDVDQIDLNAEVRTGRRPTA
jgi:hypothetical protein